MSLSPEHAELVVTARFLREVALRVERLTITRTETGRWRLEGRLASGRRARVFCRRLGAGLARLLNLALREEPREEETPFGPVRHG